MIRTKVSASLSCNPILLLWHELVLTCLRNQAVLAWHVSLSWLQGQLCWC